LENKTLKKEKKWVTFTYTKKTVNYVTRVLRKPINELHIETKHDQKYPEKEYKTRQQTKISN
jgi:hypothetical protein